MSRGGPAAVELNADCPSCGLESGVVEIYDVLLPACRFGVPATAKCKLCGEQHDATIDRDPARAMREIAANRCPACLGELAPSALDDRRCAACGVSVKITQVAPPADLGSELALLAALDAWTVREKWASRDALLKATFCEPDLATLLALIAKREPLEVVADPFANMGMKTTGKKERRAKPAAAPPSEPFVKVVEQAPPRRPLPAPTFNPPPPRPAPAPPPPAPPPPGVVPPRTSPGHLGAEALTSPPISAPPRAVVYPLVSVVAADGEIHPAERELVDRFLQSEGLAPLTDDEFKVHHPSAVAHLVPKERREAVVQLMCETATVDGMPDESERRVIRAYATAWNVPDEKVEFWMWGYESMSTGLVRQLWMKLRRFVLSARWSDTQ